MHSSRHLALLGASLLLVGCNGGRPSAQLGGSSNSLMAARAALDEGEAGTSLAIAQGVLTSRPNNVPALVQSGDAEAVLGDRLAAQTSYRHALGQLPRDIHARLGMAKLQIRDDVRGAEASFRAILADAPRDPATLNDLGYVLDLQERHVEAQDCYLKAIAADPERMPSRVNLALSLSLSGQPERAEQMLRDVAAISNPSRKVRLDFAVTQVMAGHDKDATQTLEEDLSPGEAVSAIDGLSHLRPRLVVATTIAQSTR